MTTDPIRRAAERIAPCDGLSCRPEDAEHHYECPAFNRDDAERIIREELTGPSKTGIDAPTPELGDHLGWVQYKCAVYWNEHHIPDAEVHAVLKGIYRHAESARAERAELLALANRLEEDAAARDLRYRDGTKAPVGSVEAFRAWKKEHGLG